jgi:CPA2 family monovalent cation:H+ antiporter-2
MAMDGLKAFGVPAVAIDGDADRFMAALSDGYDVSFGDPSDLRLMKTVGVTNARALALGKSRYEISSEVTEYVNETYPDLARFVVVESETEAEQHRALGMTAVINRSRPEGLDFAASLLRYAGVEEAEIAHWMRRVHDRYQSAPMPRVQPAA